MLQRLTFTAEDRALKDSYIEDPAFAGSAPSQFRNVGGAAISGWGSPIDGPYAIAVYPPGSNRQCRANRANQWIATGLAHPMSIAVGP